MKFGHNHRDQAPQKKTSFESPCPADQQKDDARWPNYQGGAGEVHTTIYLDCLLDLPLLGYITLVSKMARTFSRIERGKFVLKHILDPVLIASKEYDARALTSKQFCRRQSNPPGASWDQCQGVHQRPLQGTIAPRKQKESKSKTKQNVSRSTQQ